MREQRETRVAPYEAALWVSAAMKPEVQALATEMSESIYRVYRTESGIETTYRSGSTRCAHSTKARF